VWSVGPSSDRKIIEDLLYLFSSGGFNWNHQIQILSPLSSHLNSTINCRKDIQGICNPITSPEWKHFHFRANQWLPLTRIIEQFYLLFRINDFIAALWSSTGGPCFMRVVKVTYRLERPNTSKLANQ
jgi:hypothetical protein